MTDEELAQDAAVSFSLLAIAVERYGYGHDQVGYALVGACGLGIGAVIMRFLQRYGETMPMSAKKIEATDAAMIAVVATYVVPFLGKASDITASVVLCLIALLAAVLWMTSALIPHPVLRILGYRFYKLESDQGVVYTLITQRDLKSPRDISFVKFITSSMLVEAQ